MTATIIYYIVSPVHVRNAKLLSVHLPDWNFHLVYESISPWLNERTLSTSGFPSTGFNTDGLPDSIWEKNIDAVIFSTLQPRGGPLALLEGALQRNIATIAIEESNQIALNRGSVNNYILPVDKVLTASDSERMGMVQAGFPAARFAVTGWPFYGGSIGRVAAEEKAESKKSIGLDPLRPVAALTLTGLHDAGESPVVRERQLSLAAQGLPSEYQLVIKPHPIESLQSLMPFVDKCAPRARVLEGSVRVEELLKASDVLLNRGVSQVCIEALFQGVPVIVLETGIRTPFHGLVDSLIVHSPEQMPEALDAVVGNDRSLQSYEPFYKEHVPYTPEEARAKTCAVIAEVAGAGRRENGRGGQWFDMALYWGWVGQRRKAVAAVGQTPVGESDCPRQELLRLLEYNAEHADFDRLLNYFGTGFRADFLRGLWISQLVSTSRKPGTRDLEILSDFPPDIQTVWFVPNVREWAMHLAQNGFSELADNFVCEVCKRHVHVPGFSELERDYTTYTSGIVGRSVVIWKSRVIRIVKTIRNTVYNR